VRAATQLSAIWNLDLFSILDIATLYMAGRGSIFYFRYSKGSIFYFRYSNATALGATGDHQERVGERIVLGRASSLVPWPRIAQSVEVP
jgi:hypothetical protein